MLRSLLVGVFLLGSGCPHNGPGPITPVDPVADSGAEMPPAACNVTRVTQDRLTSLIVNACASGASLDAAMGPDVAVARCVMTDILLDERQAPGLEACVRAWMASHGGAP